MKKLSILLPIVLGLAACDNRTAEQVGEDLAKEKIGLIKGVGEVVKDEGENTADTVAQGVGNVVNGLGAGFDKSLFKADVRISESIPSTSLVATRAQKLDSAQTEGDGLSVYLTSQDGYSGPVRLIAVSDDGEVGRSKADVAIAKGDAAYVDFVFDKRTPLGIVKFYRLEKIDG